MASWNGSENGIRFINYGTSPNDGTGDAIRDAFIKVDDNFGNLSAFLAEVKMVSLSASCWS